MASTALMMSSFSLKPSPFSTSVEKAAVPSLARPSSSKLTVKASGGKKISTDKPYGINGGMNLQDGVDASGRRAKGKGVYQFVNKYGANVDGYSPIYDPDEWSPSGDVYVGELNTQKILQRRDCQCINPIDFKIIAAVIALPANLFPKNTS